jgi:hypothetical protein
VRRSRDEGNEGEGAKEQGKYDRHASKSRDGGLDQAVNNPAKPHSRQNRARNVQPSRIRVSALGDVTDGDEDDRDGERHVEQERRSPGDVVYQIAAQNRAESRCDAGETGPRPNGLAAILLSEGRADDRERPRNQQRPADALNRPCGDKVSRCQGEPARHRRHREDSNAEQEDSPPSVMVAEGAADQDQGGQEQRVGRDDPLCVNRTRPQALLYLGQRNVRDRAVYEDHRRADDRGCQNPRCLGTRTRC